MGWTGDYMIWNRSESNKDLLMRSNSWIKKGVDEGKYKLSQKGSDVYMLYQCDIENSEDFGKWFVMCWLCRRNAKNHEFLTKDIDALSNHRYDFPKNWCSQLDRSIPTVKEYLDSREEYEQKQKSKTAYKVGDVLHCKNGSYALEWTDGKTIAPDEEFFVRVSTVNPYAKRKQMCFIIADKDDRTRVMTEYMGFSEEEALKKLKEKGLERYKFTDRPYRISKRTQNNITILNKEAV